MDLKKFHCENCEADFYSNNIFNKCPKCNEFVPIISIWK